MEMHKVLKINENREIYIMLESIKSLIIRGI